MPGNLEITLGSRLTITIEQLLRVADTSAPGLWALYAYEGEICLDRRDFVPKEAHRIIFLSGNDIKCGLTADQWRKIQSKIIMFLLKGVLKL